MCQRVTCKTCGKATYQGCGMHVEQVLAGVPDSERCSCGEGGAASAKAAQTGAAGAGAGAGAGGNRGGLLSRLLGSRQR